MAQNHTWNGDEGTFKVLLIDNVFDKDFDI